MDKKDKDYLLSGLYMLGLGVLAMVFVIGADKLNLWLIAGLAIAAQQLYVIPQFIKKYMGLYDADAGILAYVPVYGEAYILDDFYKWGYIGSAIVWVLALLGVFIDPALVGKVLPYNVAINFNNIAIYVLVLTTFILSIIRGIGYSKVISDIGKQLNTFSEGERNLLDTINIVSYVSCFIPGMRVIGIAYKLGDLTRMVDINNYTVGDYVEEEE